MKKIYLIIAGTVLTILIVISIILSLSKKPTINGLNNAPFPTIALPGISSSPQVTSSLPPEINNSAANLPINLSSIAPIETADFKMKYSFDLNKIVVERKTPQADQQFNEWANQNNYPQLINNLDKVSIFDAGQAPPDSSPLLDFLNIFMNAGQGSQQSTINNQQSLNSSSSSLSPNGPTPNPSSFSYFPQCGDFGDLALPDGCNLCQAGCGPTTVSMIATSYLGTNFDPKTIVNLYRSKGYLLGCGGSRYSDAHELLSQLGLKTTDYLVFNSEKATTVVPELRPYLNAGWTFFTLASYCDGGCGHYFWITDIDSQGNIFAYDPYYGRYEIPYNENSRNPYPLYRLAFGVKK